jgi:aldehyde:ferredoxin oxidoreductase
MENRTLLGYSGRILRVDLSSRQVSVEEPPEQYYKRYLGGRGFIAPTLLQEVAAKADPLGPDNKLIFALGPLTGMPFPGSGRNSVGAKSPLTSAFGEAEAGGFWGAELRKAGWDAVIVSGIADSPVYLSIQDEKVELRDASHLWGMEVAPTHFALQKELGDPLTRTTVIGSAGERLVRFACILNDITHAAGRTGLGAVMGSKKLKAVAVRGRNNPQMAAPNVIADLARWMGQNFKEKAAVWKYGTGHMMEGYSLAGNLPTFNFQDGGFEHVKNITAVAVCDQFRVEMYGCYACPIRCKKRIKIDSPYSVDPIYGGPDYETLGALGSNCGIADPKAICKAHEICNRSGLDTISAGVTISFAMECFEKGLLKPKDTGGIELRFGNAEAMLDVLEQIVQKQGLGALLSEGSRRAAKQIGGGSEEFAVQVKGLEVPMHDPRLKQGIGLHYSVHAAGADHCSGPHDTLLEKGAQFEEWSAIDVNESIPSTELSPRKARMVYQYGMWRHLSNYVGMCVLVPYSSKQISDAVEAVTGWPMSYWRLMKTAERGMTLARIFNIREGFTSADDVLPRRLNTSQRGGNLKGVIVDPGKLSEAQNLYYQMLGWNEEGVPTRARLVELDIPWALSYLESPSKKK